MPFIKSQQKGQDPVKIYYEDWGNGKPLVLIHGWPVSHEMWEYQSTVLPYHGFRCIQYDRRGFGNSDKPWNGYDYSSLAADLKALLDELDLKDVTLVGFSMAGGEVVRYCSLYDCERISNVVLVSSIVPYMLKTDNNTEGVPQEVFDKMINDILNDRPAFLTEFGKTFFGETLINHPVSSEVLEWMHGLALRGSMRATIECLKSFSSTDFRNELKYVKVPTLVVHGDADKTVPIKATSEEVARLMPGAVYKRYEGAPHGLFVIEKEQLTVDIIQFVNEGTVMLDYTTDSAKQFEYNRQFYF